MTTVRQTDQERGGRLDAQPARSDGVYFANVGPKTGPVKYRDVLGSIGVLEAPDNHMPIGQASCVTWDEHGRAVWVLTIGVLESPDPGAPEVPLPGT